MERPWEAEAMRIVRSMLRDGSATWLAKDRVEYSSILDMYKEQATDFVMAELEKRRA